MPPASRLVRRRNTAGQPSIRFSSMTDNLMLHSLNSRSSEIRRRETNLSNECEAIRTLGFYGSRHRKIAWIKFDSVVNFGLPRWEKSFWNLGLKFGFSWKKFVLHGRGIRGIRFAFFWLERHQIPKLVFFFEPCPARNFTRLDVLAQSHQQLAS